MSGSRFVYILFLILLGFGGGAFVLHNWGTLKNYVPTEVSSKAEDAGKEVVSVYEKIKTGAQAIFFRSGPDRVIHSPVGPTPGSSSITSAQSAGGPRFGSMVLTRKDGSMFSGNAAPGSQVTVEANGRSLGRTRTNKNGNWQMFVDEPMPESNYKFGLVSRGAGSSTKIKRGENSIVTFLPEDGDNKVVSFSKSGIGALVENSPKPKIPLLPKVTDSKTTRLEKKNIPSASNDVPSNDATSDDDVTITDDLLKKAGRLADDASRKFTEVLDDLKSSNVPEKKIALAPGVAPSMPSDIAPKSPNAATEIQAPDAGLNVDGAFEKAGELASDAKAGIVGYLEKLGLSEKTDTDPVVKPAVKKIPEKVFAALLFDKVSMDNSTGSSGKIQVSGRAQPGAKISVFIGQRSIGSATADSSGRWSFEGMRNIPYGRNLLRAMQRGEGGEVLSKAQYSMRRIAPKTIVIAEKAPPIIWGKSTERGKNPEKKMAAARTRSQPAAPITRPSPTKRSAANVRSRYSKAKSRSKRKYRSAKKRKKRIRLASAKKRRKNYRKSYRKKYKRPMRLGAGSRVTKKLRKYHKRKKYGRKFRRRGRCKRGYVSYRVRRGDSLWKISKRRYGNGRRYGRIYRANRKRIANPNRIYRSQRLCLRRR